MERILNFDEPLDVKLLDQVVYTFYTGSGPQQAEAERVLAQLQEHPQAWSRVDTILEYSESQSTKFLALSILEKVILYRWKSLPRAQCDGIRNYIVNLVIKLSSDAATMQKERFYLKKLNMILVQIIKQEWPRNWETFIPELVGASQKNESLCENNMEILKLLSEEVFDFSGGQLTQDKIKELKTSFNKEFSLIYQLCEYILNTSQSPSLIEATLKTLLRFLNWIPVGYIFQTKMVENLIFKFFPIAPFQNITLQCLTEVVGIKMGEQNEGIFTQLFTGFMQQLHNILPPSTNLAEVYENGTEEQQQFIQNLAIFFGVFFKNHLKVLESEGTHMLLLEAHNYLIEISQVTDSEVWKICLEYWTTLASSLYQEFPAAPSQVLMLNSHPSQSNSPRRSFYAPIMSRLRKVIIQRMPKPEEVLIVEDENGEIVREVMKDSDAIILYKSMRETLIYLTHLDYEDTQSIMLEKLNNQVNGQEWSWNNLNTLCWAIGSISGAQSEEDEKRFLVTVIKELLGLCEMKRGKDNKAVIASNIMYIVGQYPRFLRAHWKFLKTVVNKLFEFMHETHPGVQDMACDTFLKIAQKCRRKFVVCQIGETAPFVEEILTDLPVIISDLEPQQIQTFYEAVGFMIHSHTDPKARKELVIKLMALPNSTWTRIMEEAQRDVSYLKQTQTCKSITTILKTNVRAAKSLGHDYIYQLGTIFMDMLNVYKVYSTEISNTVASNGPNATKTSIVRSMRAVKKETLTLQETFIEKSEDPQIVMQNFIPPLLEAVLIDYKNNIPDARDPEVLSLMTVIINKFKQGLNDQIPPILAAVFECTLQMITQNFEDYPVCRVNFFNLIRAINTHCFPAFFQIPPETFKLIIDSIVWAFKHTMRNIAETGLNILLELLKNIAASGEEVAQGFYKAYFINLVQDIFYVLTDAFHKSSFSLQATILARMFHLVESGQVRVPLWDTTTNQDPAMNNSVFLRNHMTHLLLTAFPHLSKETVHQFVMGLFERNTDISAFKLLLRDFLVQLKEFSEQDNSELFLEEKEQQLAEAQSEQLKRDMAIPGMVAPHDARVQDNSQME
ncbi:Exportin-1 [Balamuthia mandrillaris]